MKLYHVTTPEAARAIKTHGFRDTRGSYGMTDANGAPFELVGVFLADRRVDSQEGVSLRASVFFVVEIPASVLNDYELVEDGKQFREWCVPARLVNKYFKQRTPREC